ncbi:DUF7696 family protein [Robbsia andropogonis]|uniref:DUF7696 family protein n=1 Tax=Robbsia andropogonis TaxID=28092 RepID=UPI003D1B034C
MVDTASEQHRAECELRWLAQQPLHARRDFLALVEKRRGIAAAEALKAGLTKIWRGKR